MSTTRTEALFFYERRTRHHFNQNTVSPGKAERQAKAMYAYSSQRGHGCHAGPVRTYEIEGDMATALLSRAQRPRKSSHRLRGMLVMATVMIFLQDFAAPMI